jgi:hypothetical protein
MNEDERRVELLETLRWWDGEIQATSAEQWHLEHGHWIRGIATGQWEWVARAGEGAQTYAAFREAVDRSLCKLDGEGNPRKKDGKLMRRWEPAELADALLAELDRASTPDRSQRMDEFEKQAQALRTEEGKAAAERLRQRNRVEQAQEFLAALVKRIKAERGLEEVK